MTKSEVKLQLLRIEKITLLCSLEQQIEDLNLTAEIRTLVGEETSMPGLFYRLFRRGQMPAQERVDKIRTRIADSFPEALPEFDRLLEVFRRLQSHETTMIMF